MHPSTRKEREVLQAITSLREQGLLPHEIRGEKIGERLKALGYKKGSNSDISRIKRHWLEQQMIQKGEHDPEYAIPLLSDPIMQAAIALREKITAETTEELKRVTQEFKAHITRLETQKEELTEQLTHQTHHLVEQQQSYRDLNNLYQQHTATIEKLTLAHHTELNRTQALETQLQQLQQQHDKHITLVCDTHQADKQHYEKRLNELQQHYRSDIDQLKTTLERQRHEAIFDAVKLQDEKTKLEQQLLHSQHNLKQRQQQEKKLTEEVAQQLVTLKEIQEKNQILTAEKTTHLIMIETENKLLKQHLVQRDQKIEALYTKTIDDQKNITALRFELETLLARSTQCA